MNSIKETLINIRAELTNHSIDSIDKNFDTFPYSFTNWIKAEEDGSNTDLYRCSITKHNYDYKVDVTVVFNVNVLPVSKTIQTIELSEVDVICNGILYDCIDLMNDNILETVSRKIRCNVKNNMNTMKVYMLAIADYERYGTGTKEVNIYDTPESAFESMKCSIIAYLETYKKEHNGGYRDLIDRINKTSYDNCGLADDFYGVHIYPNYAYIEDTIYYDIFADDIEIPATISKDNCIIMLSTIFKMNNKGYSDVKSFEFIENYVDRIGFANFYKEFNENITNLKDYVDEIFSEEVILSAYSNIEGNSGLDDEKFEFLREYVNCLSTDTLLEIYAGNTMTIDMAIKDIESEYMRQNKLPFFTNKKYIWKGCSDDGCYVVKSETSFNTKKDCYNDMRNAVLEKMKWNTEFDEDFPDGKESCVDYNVTFSTDKIQHASYSGLYTYTIEEIFE